MAGVFISYRRGDTAGFSGRLCDSLRDVFGPERVFMDVAGSIEPGADFHQVLESAVAAADVFVVMIGPEWLEVTGQDGRRRLEDPEDWVRSEVATALERQVRVVPVLVDGATMPQKDELPDSLKTLAKRNAIELRAARWDSDVEELVKVLRKDLGEEKAALPWLKWAVAGGVLVLAGLLAWHFWPRVTEPQEVEIPPLTGLSFEQAQAELGQLALRARRFDIESTSPEGKVFEQHPAAGAKVPPDSEIQLRVAKAPPVIVPDLEGESFEEARRQLKALQLGAVQTEAWEETAKHPELTVRTQDPLPGSKVEPGDVIELTLARYPVRDDPDNSIHAAYFCAEKSALQCTLPLLGDEEAVGLSELRLGEINGQSTRVLYYSTVAELNGKLEYLVHVWDRKLDDGEPVGERCGKHVSKRIQGNPSEELSATLTAGTDCLKVVMPANEASGNYRLFSMRSVPGPGTYYAEVQDASGSRLQGAKRLTIRVDAD